MDLVILTLKALHSIFFCFKEIKMLPDIIFSNAIKKTVLIYFFQLKVMVILSIVKYFS